MAEGINRVTLLGNLGADPELRFTSGGQAVLNLRIATTESYLDKDKQRKERTDWHSVVMWGKRGEALSKLLAKGSRLLVEGRIQTSSYEKDGEKRYKTEINATNVVLCDGRGERGASSSDGDGARRSAPSTPARGGAKPSDADFETGDDIPF